MITYDCFQLFFASHFTIFGHSDDNDGGNKTQLKKNTDANLERRYQKPVKHKHGRYQLIKERSKFVTHDDVFDDKR